MIDMKKQYLGIDLGTSAVKLLLLDAQGNTKGAKCAYTQKNAAGWCEALKNAVAEMKQQDDLANLEGIALSSQVGTYLTDGGEVLGWESPAGMEELERVKASFSKEEWIRQIGMVHPVLNSYPIPRLLYMQKHFPDSKAVYMPKEMLLQELTGHLVADAFSWRGLCNAESKAYSQGLLDYFDIRVSLPEIALPTDIAGCITDAASTKYGLPQGVPVYVGCNDFYAGLLGMGVWESGSIFELSGTSEHLGVVTDTLLNDKFVSSPYFRGYVTYGGTKSSGASCNFALQNFDVKSVEAKQAFQKPPIFLPYLNGERAPVYDENARGVFFGIGENTNSADMAYAILEGVVFSLYHISQSLPLPEGAPLITGGGSSGNRVMAKLKAALFGRPVLCVEQKDSSALGAAILAMVGSGVFPSAGEGAKAMVTYETVAEPDAKLQKRLLQRYALYQKLYEQVRTPFADFSKI